MPLWRLYYHLVWATKEREPLIQPAVETDIYKYIVSKAAEIDVYVYAINGWYDHVHMIVGIPPKHAVASVVKRIKGASSRFMNQSGLIDQIFAWQEGYGVFSLGEKQRPSAEAYVHNQKKHHTEQTTNAWLEYTTGNEEGPDNRSVYEQTNNQLRRENRILYQTNDEFPF
jgi:putative transposase